MFAIPDNKSKSLPKVKAQGDNVSPSAKDQIVSNPAWQSLALSTVGLQAKLTISAPSDAYEHEADRVSDQVMRKTDTRANDATLSSNSFTVSKLQRKCSGCDDEEENKVQRKEQTQHAESRASAPATVHEALNSPGHPLDPFTLSSMENRFGRDFSDVRVHSGAAAEQSAQGVNARAYTVGHDIVFDTGQFSLGSLEGKKLLAHELTHVVQQGGKALGLQRAADPEAEREEAVKEALAVAARIDQQLKNAEKEDDDQPNAEPGPKPRPHEYKTPSKFSPGGFTDEEIYGDYNQATKRIDEDIDRERKITKRPYSDRLYQARQIARSASEYWYNAKEANERMTGAEVWRAGVNHDLFVESEKRFVYEDQSSLQQLEREEREERQKQAKRDFEIEQHNQLVAQGEQLSSPAPFIQGFAFAAFGPWLGAAYGGFQTGQIVGDAYNACAHGTGSECAAGVAESGVSIGIAVVSHRATRGAPQTEALSPSPSATAEPDFVITRAAKPDPATGKIRASGIERASGRHFDAEIDPHTRNGQIVDRASRQVVGIIRNGEIKAPAASNLPPAKSTPTSGGSDGRVVSRDAPIHEANTGSQASSAKTSRSAGTQPTNERPAPAGAGTVAAKQPTIVSSSNRTRFEGTARGDVALNPGVGLSRELRVAEEVGGRVTQVGKRDLKFRTPSGEGVTIDVLGPNQELIVVGGPAKAIKLSDLGGNLKRLKELASAHGVKALAYFEEGTPDVVIEIAIKWLGKENVHTFK
jgi:hypothetical protein